MTQPEIGTESAVETTGPDAAITDSTAGPGRGQGGAGDDATVDSENDADTDARPGNEAAKWRRKLRDTEQKLVDTQIELDSQRELVLALRRAHVERILAPTSVKPEAVWSVVELGDVLGENNLPDERLIDKAVDQARRDAEAFSPRPAE